MKQLPGRSPSGLFATQTLTGHVIRGAAAFALLYLAIAQQHSHPVASLMAGVLALVAMRGCPVCWAIGLAETIRLRHGAPLANVSPDKDDLRHSTVHVRVIPGEARNAGM
jgi:hypothetical protein